MIEWRAVSLHEIVLPETKPETEWVRGRALQKVSPTYDHAILQRLLSSALGDWADAGGHGRVGPEWGFRVAPPGAVARPLVPDVGYLSYAVLPQDVDRDLLQVPLAAPTVAIEILSPDDRMPDVADKITTYLAAGTSAVVVVDPRTRTVAVHDEAGTRTLHTGDALTHPALPGFSLDLAAMFSRVT